MAEISQIIRSSRVAPRSRASLIVVGVDGSETADSALRWALEEAKLHGDTVEAVSVWPASFISRGLNFPVLQGVTPERRAREEVRAALARIGGAGAVPVSVVCVYGNPGPALRRAASARPADLVVIGRTAENLGYEVLAGSVSRAVRRGGARPVVVVPPSWDAATRHGVIAVGVDGTRRARAALRWALVEAEHRQASVRAVLAWDSSPRAHAAGSLPVVADSPRAAEAYAQSVLEDEISTTFESSPNASETAVTPITVRAAAHAALLRESAAADLLVLGDHRRSGVNELLLGSTTRICLRHAPSPVVLVPISS